MTHLCSFVLDDGHRCAAPALRDSDYCRHHEPTVPDAQPTRALTAAYWLSTFCRSILAQDLEGLQDHTEGLLQALGDRAICHRSAGRLFAAIEDRRRELRRKAEQAAMRKVQEAVANCTLPDPGFEGLKPKNSEFEALKDLLSTELLRARGPQTKNATRDESNNCSKLNGEGVQSHERSEEMREFEALKDAFLPGPR